jgi:hypothetical protein
MNATETLKAILAAGICVATDGGDLVLQGEAPPPAPLLDTFKHHKQAIVALLTSYPNVWSGEDCLMFFEERAATLEFDGGCSRHEAEVRALEECFEKWRCRCEWN